MIQLICLSVFYAFLPLAILSLCRKSAFFGKVGEVLIAYAIGMLIGNTGLFDAPGAGSLQEVFISASIPLAIPLMLFSSESGKWLSMAKPALISFCLAVAAVLTSILSGYYFFGDGMGGSYAKIAGLMAGVYTGGTPNLASLKLMLNVDETAYISVHTYDMLLSFLYLLFIMSAGLKLFSFILSSKEKTADDFTGTGQARYFEGFKFTQNYPDLLKGTGLAALTLAAGAGVMAVSAEAYKMAALILSITSLGIAFSFVPGVNKIKYTSDTGMYLILVFSIVLASKVNLTELAAVDFTLFGYIAYVIAGTLILHSLLCRLFKIDAGTVIITTVALICSPPFVPVVAASIKNKSVIMPGITIGVIGYAIGTYLGFIIYSLLGG